jgi:acetyl esterase/lipase
MNRLWLLLISLVMVLSAPAWLPAQDVKPAVRVESNLVYGNGGASDLALDLALPQGEGPFPGVICIHGGAWRTGNRQQLTKTIEVLANRGYVAASVDYRLAPAAKFPAQIEDCKAAVRWLRAHAAQYHLDPERIGVVGFSAGAHLACLLGTTDKNDGLEGNGGNLAQSSRVQAVVSFFGPTDFTSKTWDDDIEQEMLVPVLGATFTQRPELYRRFSPIIYVTKDDPPFLFLHGTKDHLVNIRQSRVLAAKLQAQGIEAKVIALEDEGHGWHGAKLTRSFDDMMDFFDKHLKK